MRSIQRPDQYLKLRNDIWHYVRRVPKSVRHIDERVLIYRSLETDKGLNREAALLCLAMIETGCRPSELANIERENIRLDDEIPHIRIRSSSKRALKSTASVREIPLVGVSLEAMKCAPNGFPHYQDRGYLLSQTLLNGFKVRELLPTPNHRIYSFRHSFEKRMLEGGLDYGLRCTLMGHRNPRPEYGDGGSLKYRRDEMMKVVHPVSEEMIDGFPLKL